MAHPPEVTNQWRAFLYSSQLPFPAVTIHVLIVCNFAHESYIALRHSILAFIIPTLLGFLQIQCVGNDPSPFQVHPGTTRASVVSILCYYFAFRARLRLPYYASQLSIAMMIFGSFTVASLVSLLLPHSWWHLRYLIYFLLLEGELHPLLKKFYNTCIRRFMLQTGLVRITSIRPLLPQTYMDFMHYDGAHVA